MYPKIVSFISLIANGMAIDYISIHFVVKQNMSHMPSRSKCQYGLKWSVQKKWIKGWYTLYEEPEIVAAVNLGSRKLDVKGSLIVKSYKILIAM